MFLLQNWHKENLITKRDFDDKLKSLNTKIFVENELKKLQTFDSIYFRGKSHFEEDGTQNYLVFQPMYRYFKGVLGFVTGNYIYIWKSRGLSDENITAPLQVIIASIHNWVILVLKQEQISKETA